MFSLSTKQEIFVYLGKKTKLCIVNVSSYKGKWKEITNLTTLLEEHLFAMYQVATLLKVIFLSNIECDSQHSLVH